VSNTIRVRHHLRKRKRRPHPAREYRQIGVNSRRQAKILCLDAELRRQFLRDYVEVLEDLAS